MITLSKSKIFSLTIPAKLQSCLACGKPIIVCADGEIQKIISEAQCGFYVDAEEYDGLYDIIIKAKSLTTEEYNKMCKNCTDYFKTHFDKYRLMDEMDEYLGGK